MQSEGLPVLDVERRVDPFLDVTKTWVLRIPKQESIINIPTQDRNQAGYAVLRLITEDENCTSDLDLFCTDAFKQTSGLQVP